ncbi:MAG: hypothetical protein K1060chlam3_00640 [Candidatus Anoxychlamydiales bacterium]|nr:hypothetical protein [Candidatus Anoxychlamydiales bacterium]
MTIYVDLDFSWLDRWWPSKPNHFNHLPDEMIAEIFAQALDGDFDENKKRYIITLSALSLTETRFNRILNKDWKKVLLVSTKPLRTLSETKRLKEEEQRLREEELQFLKKLDTYFEALDLLS